MAVVRVVVAMEAATVTGPAKNLIQFARLARKAEGSDPAVEISIATYHRHISGSQADDQSTQFIDAARAAGIEVDLLSERFRYDPRVLRELAEVVARRAPDIVQTHMVKSHFLMRLSGLHHKNRWIAIHHGYTAEDLKMRLYNQLNRWSLPAAERVVTVCGAFADDLVRTGVNRERIRVLPNSIAEAPSMAADAVRALRGQLAISADERVVLSIGRFSKEKAQTDLIRAIFHLRRAHPGLKFRLILVGDGPERRRVEQAVVAAGLSGHVIFAGHQRDVGPYYGLADLFVSPSRSEGSPNVLLEAMAAGVPIVATAVGGVPETVQDETSALLTRASDTEALAASMGRLLTNPGLAGELAENARISIKERFSPRSYRRSLIGIYSELCRGATRPSA